MLIVKKFKKLKGSKKKYEIIFNKNGKEYIRKFGAEGMSDFTMHKDINRRERYISRHKKDLKTNDPMKPGYLSMYILWNKPTIKASLADYKRRLNIYNKTGKFPKDIKGSKKLSFGTIIPFENTSLNVLSPDVQSIIQREVSASDIQKQAKKFLYNKNKIIRILKKIGKYRYDKTGDSKFIDNILLNYDITNSNGYQVTMLAYTYLTKDDFKNKSFWWKLVKDGLQQMYEIHAESYDITNPILEDFSNVDEFNNFEMNEELLIKLVNRAGVPWDFSELEFGIRALDNLMYDWENLDSTTFGKKYDVPENVVNKKLYESIKNKIKKSIKGRRWGAYDSGRLVKEYKTKGGKYSGKKGKTNLSRWYKEKWVDACKWPKRKPCGRKTDEKIAYCRPSVKISSKTPKLIQRLTKKQIKSRCDRKKKNPLIRINKFGNVSTPDEPVAYGDGSWVIHCSYHDYGAHSTIRYKPLSERPNDYSYHYGRFNNGDLRYWATGEAKFPIPLKLRKILKTHFDRKCLKKQLTRQNTMDFYNIDQRGTNLFGGKNTINFFNGIFNKKGGVDENSQKEIIKRCGSISEFSNLKCQERVTTLFVSIYLSLYKKYKIKPSSLDEFNTLVKKYEKKSSVVIKPVNITIYRSNISDIKQFAAMLQDHSYGMFENARIAFLVYEYIVNDLNM